MELSSRWAQAALYESLSDFPRGGRLASSRSTSPVAEWTFTFHTPPRLYKLPHVRLKQPAGWKATSSLIRKTAVRGAGCELAVAPRRGSVPVPTPWLRSARESQVHSCG
ncbi:hypothetical protein AAFF_G00335660 [Aldrovandia affinis]|uniref:Uncharacterized protein n=1 Tax=Aldrovandia affinis TaxID=143900 RepID=A0AAD7SM26_9TELE|nr:hypothetical protein AAFF_G00335660 [Aldrovandia affinis]